MIGLEGVFFRGRCIIGSGPNFPFLCAFFVSCPSMLGSSAVLLRLFRDAEISYFNATRGDRREVVRGASPTLLFGWLRRYI